MKQEVIGLVGAIGAGKSTVSDWFSAAGAVSINADRVGHEVLAEPAIARKLADLFGNGILDAQGAVDRRRLGGIVFRDPGALRRLEAVVHPQMRRRFEQAIATFRAEGKASRLVLDAAVLFEAGWDDLCDRVLFVDADRAVRAERLRRTRGWDAGELERREQAQLPLEEKRRRADWVVTNDGAVEDCYEQLDRLCSSQTVVNSEC